MIFEGQRQGCRKCQAGKRKASETGGVDDTTGHGGGAPRPTWNCRCTLFLWKTQRRRAATAMSPPICRRPGCRSSKSMPLSQHRSQTWGSFVSLKKAKGGGQRRTVVQYSSHRTEVQCRRIYWSSVVNVHQLKESSPKNSTAVCIFCGWSSSSAASVARGSNNIILLNVQSVCVRAPV